MLSVSSAIHWWARRIGDQAAVIVGPDRLSFRNLHEWSGRIARSLCESGLKPGDRVSICAANSIEYCALIFGVIRAGGIVSPISVRYTLPEIEEILEDTTPIAVFADPERLAALAPLKTPLRDLNGLSALRHEGEAAFERDHDPDAAIVIISTSGSTAKPKGVMLTHRSMTSYASAFALEVPEISHGSRIIAPAPLNTSAGFVQLLHYTLMGCTVYLEPTFEPTAFLQILEREKINGFGSVPLFFERIAQAPGFASADLSSIKVATTGGAAVSRELQAKWMARGIVLRQIYGQTEAGGNATIMPSAEARTYPEKCGDGGIFTEIRVVDADGKPVPAGEQGQIVLRGPGMMKGYWNNPEATAAAIKDGWLQTGDIGVLDENGMLTFVDRMKDIIISGGLNISAAEVERCVGSFPGVEEVVVIAAKSDKFGETPMAVVYAPNDISVPDLITHCNERLADYKVPRYVAVEREPLPRLATGKLSKPLLREKYKNASEQLERVR